MKKIISIILVLSLMASFSACNSKTNQSSSEEFTDNNSLEITDVEATINQNIINWDKTVGRTISNLKYSVPQDFINASYDDNGVIYKYENGMISIFINKQPLENAEVYSCVSEDGVIIFAVESDDSKKDIEKLKGTIIVDKSTTNKPVSTTTKSKTTTRITTPKRTTTTPKTTVTTTTTNRVQLGTSNALGKAKDYLNVMAFSYLGLIKQLEYEQFTHDEAVYGADNCGANWYEQATKKAQDYLNTMSFSYSGLIKQLEYEQFTHDEAVYGADNCGANWYEQATKKAQDYLNVMSFSRQELINQLVYDGFSQNEAEYGVSAVGY